MASFSKLSHSPKRSLWRCSKTLLNIKFTESETARHPIIKIVSGNSAKGYEYELSEPGDYAKLEDRVMNSLEKGILNITKEWATGPLVAHQ